MLPYHDEYQAIADALRIKPRVQGRMVEAAKCRHKAPQGEELCENSSCFDKDLLYSADVGIVLLLSSWLII